MTNDTAFPRLAAACRSLTILAAALGLTANLCAAAPVQLRPPVSPPENPWTDAKAKLGKVLFWDEQLSSTDTVACGTCHRPEAGFADPRSLGLGVGEAYPGVDRIHGTDDDVLGSPSLPTLESDGHYGWRMGFGAGVQVTNRNTPTVLNAAYEPALFLDGRATGELRDPITGLVVSPTGAALEHQALGPLLSDKEMSRSGRTTPEVAGEMRWMWPLALAEDLPPDLAAYIGARRYPALFEEAFGDTTITGVRFAQAIASYLRTLVTPDLPYDRFVAGDPGALDALERAGHDLFFGAAGCARCHPGPLFTDHAYHALGIDGPPGEPGRRMVTHDPRDHGKFRTNGLRNVALTAPYFHDGSARTLEDVVDFYDRGGDHTPSNLAPEMTPLGLTPAEKAALVAFLQRPLTDPRVAVAAPPFDRPRLYSESARAPRLLGAGSPGSAGFTPRMIVIEPPRRGGDLTLAVDRATGGAPATLVSAQAFLPAGQPLHGSTLYVPLGAGTRLDRVRLEGHGAGLGWASVRFDLSTVPNAMVGTRLYFQWLVFDPTAAGRLAASEAALVTLF